MGARENWGILCFDEVRSHCSREPFSRAGICQWTGNKSLPLPWETRQDIFAFPDPILSLLFAFAGDVIFFTELVEDIFDHLFLQIHIKSQFTDKAE